MFSLGGTCHPFIFRRFIKKNPTQKGEGENKQRHNTTPCSLRLPPGPRGVCTKPHRRALAKPVFSTTFFPPTFFPHLRPTPPPPFYKTTSFSNTTLPSRRYVEIPAPPPTPPCPTSTPFASKNTLSFPSSRGSVRERKREGGVPSLSPPSSPTTLLLPFECNVAK